MLLEMLMNQKKKEKRKKYIPSDEFTLGVFVYKISGQILFWAFQTQNSVIYPQCFLSSQQS